MRSSLSSSLLTEEERRRRNASQRRILRIQQVREQEKQYALKLLNTNKRQKSSQEDQILSDIKDEWEIQKCENMAKLQAKIDCAISHVGAAQVDANNLTQQQAKVATRAYEQLMEARVQEAKRFETACEWAQSSERQRQAPTLQKMEWRATALMTEKERAKAKVVAQMKSKASSMKTSQKENMILEPKGPQVIKSKVAPHLPNRAGVSYTSTRFHESIQNETPESPARSPPFPIPRDSVNILEEDAYTAAVVVEQAELTRGEQEREERARKALALQQRTVMAHTKLIAERQGKEAEMVLAQYEQTTRRQKAHQIGEIARLVERHVEAGDNPVDSIHLNSEFSRDDGIMGLSWSSLPREKVTKKGRKSKINRAFEEEFFSPVRQVAQEPDNVSVDIDIFSKLSDLPTPPSHTPITCATSATTTKPSSTSSLKNRINNAKHSINITKNNRTKDNNKNQTKDPNSEPPTPTSMDENLFLEDYPLSHYLTPSLPLEPYTTLDTSSNQTYHSLFNEDAEEVDKRGGTRHEETNRGASLNTFPPPPLPPVEPPPFSSPPSPSSPPSVPLHARDQHVSDEYLKDFERKMRDLDEHFHRALGYLPSHLSPSSPHPSFTSPHPILTPPPILPSPHPTPSPHSPRTILQHSQPTPQPVLQPASQPLFTSPPAPPQYPPLSSQHPSPRQSSPPPQPLFLSHQPPIAPFVYHTTRSPNVGPPSLSPQSTPPKDLSFVTTGDYLSDNTSHPLTSSHIPSPSLKGNSVTPQPHLPQPHLPQPSLLRLPPPQPSLPRPSLPRPSILPFGASIDDYPVFTFVLNSPHPPTTLPRPPPEEEDDDHEDIFSISPLSSNPSSSPYLPSPPHSPSPSLSSPPHSPYLSSSPLSNHSLSYSTDSLFMST